MPINIHPLGMACQEDFCPDLAMRMQIALSSCYPHIYIYVAGASSGYNGGPGSVGGNTYATQSHDPYRQSQHAYGNAMQPQAPPSPYGGRQGGAGGGFGGGGFGAAVGAPANPYASTAAPVPAQSPVSLFAFSNTVQQANPHTLCPSCLILLKAGNFPKGLPKSGVLDCLECFTWHVMSWRGGSEPLVVLGRTFLYCFLFVRPALLSTDCMYRCPRGEDKTPSSGPLKL